MRARFWFVGGLASVLLFLSCTADAVPTFSRKYETSCMTCHESFPRLNGIGEAFRLNGYKFMDDELYIKEEPVELGDEAYKRVFPEAVWPTTMPDALPVSLILKNEFSVDIGGTNESRSTFEFPHEVELVGAGTLGETISFFGGTRMGKRRG